MGLINRKQALMSYASPGNFLVLLYSELETFPGGLTEKGFKELLIKRAFYFKGCRLIFFNLEKS